MKSRYQTLSRLALFDPLCPILRNLEERHPQEKRMDELWKLVSSPGLASSLGENHIGPDFKTKLNFHTITMMQLLI